MLYDDVMESAAHEAVKNATGVSVTNVLEAKAQ
jgi:hypothetical protein